MIPPSDRFAERPAAGLHGLYHDVLTAPDGRVLWDRGVKRNTIVVDCHRLLAAFIAGGGLGMGIQGLRVGQGNPAWDLTAPPLPTPAQTALVDPNPFLVPPTSLQIDFLDVASAAVTPTPTFKLQIKATLGPNIPPWPDAGHVSANLREFALVGKLSGKETLINYVTHPVIVKDPASTLTRTIWLIF